MQSEGALAPAAGGGGGGTVTRRQLTYAKRTDKFLKSVGEGAVSKQLLELVAETRRESAAMFGESADNITAVCVAFDEIEPAP